jgi:hypothetical protein
MQPEVDALWSGGRITRLSKPDTDAHLAAILRMQPPASGNSAGSFSADDEQTAEIQGLISLMMHERLYTQHVCFKGLQLPDGSICFIVHVLLDKVFAVMPYMIRTFIMFGRTSLLPVRRSGCCSFRLQ